MTNEFDHIEFIEAYYRGSLDEQQLARFEELMRNDPEFEAEVQDYALLFEGFDMLHTEELSLQMNAWEARYEPAAEPTVHTPKLEIIKNERNTKKVTPMFSMKFMTRIAAAVAFLVFVPLAYFALMTSNKNSIADYFAPSNASDIYFGSSLRTGNNDTAIVQAKLPDMQLMVAALDKYNHKEYDAALQLFSDYEQKHTFIKNNVAFALYIGVCKLATDDVDGAIQTLKPLSDNPSPEIDPSLHDNTQWMLALAYYRKNDVQNARLLLETIADGNSSHAESAKKLLRRIEL